MSKDKAGNAATKRKSRESRGQKNLVAALKVKAKSRRGHSPRGQGPKASKDGKRQILAEGELSRWFQMGTGVGARKQMSSTAPAACSREVLWRW
eukprot:4497795-Pleurochrysis_carterae.AAC.2